MKLKARNKINPNFNMSSLTDIIFLLLIFFMLTSTLVSPNALKILLPNSNNQTLAPQSLTVSVSENKDYYVEGKQVAFEQLESEISAQLGTQTEQPTIVLNMDKTLSIDDMVGMFNIANRLDVKMILGTSPEN